MHIRDADEGDIGALTALYNDIVLHTTANYHEIPSSEPERLAWMRERQAGGMPVLVAVEGSELLGFSSFGQFRPQSGYKTTVEHTLAVRAEHRKKGIGRQFLGALFERARALDKRVMLGFIDAENVPSIALHAAMGFVETARMPGVAYKFGRKLELVVMQKDLG